MEVARLNKEQQKNIDEAQRLAAEAIGFTIETAEQYTTAADYLRNIKAKLKKLDSDRKAITKPLDEAKRNVMALFRRPMDDLEKAESAIKRAMALFNQEQERKRLEAQRKADEEARRERERLERQARKAEAQGKHERAAELEMRATTVAAPIVAAETPKVEGISKRRTWKWRLIDASKVPDQYKKIDEQKIGKVVRALGGETDIPGIEVYCEEGIAARA